ncbi:tail length tape measure protein [Escherichia coli]|nr:tail length tape measure protein [Escherichia coli]PZY67651.1 tail length tape measure protein [Escherichia coli]PZZ08733.1 tail length tape measure protein [Escherichia coli]
MATLRELIIKISANSQSFQSEIQRASRMGSEYYRTLQNGGRQANGWRICRCLCHRTPDFTG